MIRILQERVEAGVERPHHRQGREGPRGLAAEPLPGKRQHLRAIVRDGRAAFLGSQSLRRLELDARREIGVIVRDAKVVEEIVKIFESDWADRRRPTGEGGGQEGRARARGDERKHGEEVRASASRSCSASWARLACRHRRQDPGGAERRARTLPGRSSATKRAACTASSSAPATASCGAADRGGGPGPRGLLGRARRREEGRGQADDVAQARGADGREWKFRSIDKDPTTGAAGEPAGDLGRDARPGPDQRLAPAARLVVDALRDAAGILHASHRIVVLPDDARLGEFREEFAGMLGTLEEHPRVKPPVTPGFEAYDRHRRHGRARDAAGRGRRGAGGLARLPAGAAASTSLIGDYRPAPEPVGLGAGDEAGAGAWRVPQRPRPGVRALRRALACTLVRRRADPSWSEFERRYPGVLSPRLAGALTSTGASSPTSTGRPGSRCWGTSLQAA